MSMNAALRDRLIGSGLAGGRWFRDIRPQGSVLPAGTLLLVDGERPSTMDGRQSLTSSRVQLDVLAASRGEADAIAEDAIAVVEPAAIVGDVSFSRTFVDSLRTDSETPDEGPTIFRTSLDLLVWHQPAA